MATRPIKIAAKASELDPIDPAGLALTYENEDGEHSVVLYGRGPDTGWEPLATLEGAEIPPIGAHDLFSLDHPDVGTSRNEGDVLVWRTATGLYTHEALMGLISAASEAVSGKVELATSAETQTGTDTARAVHPAGLKSTLDARADDWRIQSGAGALFAAMGDGNPLRASGQMTMGAVLGPTPTEITTSIARIVAFKLPKTLALSAVHLHGVGATTSLYNFAIYPVTAGSAKLWDSGALTTTAGAWLTITGGTPALSGGTVSLAADTPYYFCVSALSTGTTAGFRSPAAPLSAAHWLNAGPLGGAISGALGFGRFMQFSVTSGAFPATLPTVGNPASYAGGATGSVPFAFLEGTAS